MGLAGRPRPSLTTVASYVVVAPGYEPSVYCADGSISPAYLDKTGRLVWQAPGA